jgi:alanyl-tRNA synthetase
VLFRSAIADHSRTLLFAITDGGIPSNVGGGYNLRVILRRALGFIDEFDFDFDLTEIARWHAAYLKPMFPELSTELESFDKIVNIEKGKFNETRAKIERTITSLVDKKTQFDEALLRQLYESQGITPEEIKRFKHDLEIPPTFYENITEEHSSLVEEKEGGKMITDVCATEKLCYLDKYEFDATVLKIFEDNVVLDRTAFYATSGGQEHDTGKIEGVDVLDVFKQGEVILHKVADVKKFKVGQKVKAAVDQKRRKQLAQNHSAVHLVNGAARTVLGNHVWQAGSEVKTDKARLDITHHSAITPEELKKIEDLVNEKVKAGLPITKPIVERGKAEQEYGFRVYQGGAIPQKDLRIIKMGDFDIEACGGTHCNNTKEIGQVKILRAVKIQDGVVRLEFVAGEKAKEAGEQSKDVYERISKPLVKLTKKEFRYSEDDLNGAAGVFSVTLDQLPYTLNRFVEEWQDFSDKSKVLGGVVAESGLSAAKTLTEFSSILFAEWKQRQKVFKELVNKKVQEEAKALPADNPKMRGIFFGMRMKDLEEDPTAPVGKTIEKVKALVK